MRKKLSEVAKFLDKELRVSKYTDSSNNGLQVENSGSVSRVCCGVDASIAFFEAAKKRGADLVICHHGLSWDDSLSRITGLNYKRLKYLLDNNMALYASHLPLDAHPRYGNNALICKAMKLQKVKKFAAYHGSEIGFYGSLARPMRYKAFKNLVSRVFNVKGLSCMDFGKKTVQTVGVVSGGGASAIVEAGEKGLDVFVSGEPRLSAYNEVMELEMNAVFAGHYATETFGVIALAGLLKRKYKLQTEFIDMKTPY